MRLRTFLALLILLGLAAGIIFFLVPNRGALAQTLSVGWYVVPVWGVVVGAFTVGVGVAVVFHLTGLGRGAFGGARRLWTARHRDAARRALERGRQAAREGRMEAAIASFEEATRRDPGELRGRMLLGDALRDAGRLDDAIAAHEAARSIDPDSDEPGHALVLDLLAAGKTERARRELRALVDHSPKSAIGPLRTLRDLDAAAGKWDAAERAQKKLESMLARGKRLSDEDRRQGHGIRTELARVRAKSGQPRHALSQLRRVLKEDADFLPAVVLLARLQFREGDAESARSQLVGAFERTGEPGLLDELADAELAIERPDEAISILRGQVAARRHENAARLALGSLYARLEMLDEAAAQLDTLYEETGGARLAAWRLAHVEERRGRYERAARLYREVMEAAPESVPAASCRECGAPHEKWIAACTSCHAFGTVRTDWGPPELVPAGIPANPAPVWPASKS